MEAIGLVATCFVLLSFLMRSETRIRYVNIIGAILYCVYGYTIHSTSTVILNGALITIHICYLIKRK